MADITVTIDGIKVRVPDGTYVWDAAKTIGNEIPNFCYLPGLRAFGACRMCIVEIKGRRGWELNISCGTPAKDGMEVRTLSDESWEQRHMIMELLDVDHPLDCPICEANGDCRLQDYGYEYGVIGKELRRPKIVRPAERLSPAIDLDRDRCVVCGRCVRACDEQIGAVALAFVQRGIETVIDAPFGKSLLDTPCTSCGTCVEVCPVGALSSRINYIAVHHWQQRKTRTTCEFCSVGCTIHAGAFNNRVAEIRSQDSVGVNDGIICVKGRYAQDVINSKERLTLPLIKQDDGTFAPVSWNEALNFTAQKLEANRGSVGFLAGSKLTNEELYLFQKLARAGLGTNNIDSDVRYPESTALDVLEQMLGYPAMTNNLLDTRQVAGCIMLVGDSVYENQPVYGYQLQRMVRLRDAKIVVISPRWTKMSEYAALTLMPRPGTEEVLLHGIARIIQEEGLLAGNVTAAGLAEWRSSLSGYAPEQVSEITGVTVEDMVKAAYMYATGGKLSDRPKGDRARTTTPAATQPGHGDTQPAPAVAAPAPPAQYPASTILFPAGAPYVLTPGAVAALVNLALATGNVGRPGGGVNPLVTDANSMGIGDMGCRPDRLPGYLPITAENLATFARAWTAADIVEKLSDQPGLSLPEMIAGIEEGTIKALYIAGSNPVLGAEDPQAVRQALSKLDFLVVQDLFNNETAELAHVILPASSFAEKDGTFTNTERRIQRVRKTIEPVGLTRPDSLIFVELGYRLNISMPYSLAAEIMDEIARTVPIYAGVSYPRLERTQYIEEAIPMPGALSYKQLRINGLQWPVRDERHPGTPVLYEDGATMTTQRFAAAPAQTPPAQQTADGTLLLTAGYPLFPWHTGTLSRHSRALVKVEPQPRLHLNPADARALGIGDVQPVRVLATNGDGQVMNGRRAGSVEAITLVHDMVPAGTAFLGVTQRDTGLNPFVRRMMQVQSNGHDGVKAVPVRVEPAPEAALVAAPGPATANVIDTANSELPPA